MGKWDWEHVKGLFIAIPAFTPIGDNLYAFLYLICDDVQISREVGEQIYLPPDWYEVVSINEGGHSGTMKRIDPP